MPQVKPFEFRGSGGEYFKIWIVNLALTIVTLGIFGPWAKVRTWRYFYGSTYLDGHSFDYHASPLRILLGRVIALVLFLGYALTAQFGRDFVGIWVVVFIFALPWLAISSIRFNARNTSYRNVRFNFTGRYWTAFRTYILWPLAGALTLGALIPRARKAQDYFYVNHHTYGGRSFETNFSTWSIYAVYLIAFGIIVVGFAIMFGGTFALLGAGGPLPVPQPGAPPPPQFYVIFALFYLFFILAIVYVQTAVYNLSISHTVLDGRHELRSRLSVWRVLWLWISNVFLLLITLGIYYPWAMVRVARYHRETLSLIAVGDLDGYASDVVATQSAIGEEIAGFFDLGFGL